MKDLKYLAAYLIPFFCILGLIMGGFYTYCTVIFAFILIPTIEPFLPNSRHNYSQEEKKQLLSVKFFDWLLYFNLPIIYGTIGLFLFVLIQQDLLWYELVGNLLSVGVVLGANGINVGHELGHRKEKADHIIAQLLLLPSFYMHFFVEHNRGHHKHVATDLDPASARKNENVYAFWIRSTVGSYKSAWKLESQRLKKQDIPFWSPANQMITFTVAQVIYLSAIFFLAGTWGTLMIIIAGVIGFLNLETINYIEHYGLRRKMLPSGNYERVQPSHSWNANYEAGRIILYELTRHSDHHYLASKKYQVLDHHDISPELPVGYPGAMLMSLVPPLWFKVMNSRIPEQVIS